MKSVVSDSAKSTIHAFEAAGLGLAPFRFGPRIEHRVGPITLPCGSQVGAPGQPMGTCDFCGTGIADCYVVRSSDGKEFVVGCDCIRKTGDAGLRKVINEEQAKKRRAASARKAAALALRQGEVIAAHVLSEGVAAEMSVRTHPFIAGKSMRDYYDFMMANCGHGGKLKAIRIAAQIAEEIAR